MSSRPLTEAVLLSTPLHLMPQYGVGTVETISILLEEAEET